MDAAEEFDLCSLDELKARMALSFEFRHPRLGRHEVAVFWDGEKAGAMDNYCPHQGAMLSYGLVERGEVVCPLHAAVFDIVTGECLDRYTDDTPRRTPSRFARGASGCAPPASASFPAKPDPSPVSDILLREA